MGIMNNPSAIPRPSPPRTIPTNNLNNPSGSNKHGHGMADGQRLRAATSFSPYHPPSSMAIRHTGTMAAAGSDSGNSNTSVGRSLTAIAGPMGITIVDAAAPQRPWLVLNYSSSLSDTSASPSRHNNIGGNRVNAGGISTMAFQPCQSTLNLKRHPPAPASAGNATDGPSYGGMKGGFSYSQSASSPILLATARGSGILVWDCSGRALSPLLGRLNASDSRGGGGGISNKTNNNAGIKRNKLDDAATIDGHSMGSEESGTKQPTQQSSSSSAGVESNVTASQDTFKSMLCSPISLERKPSLISVSSSSSLVTSNTTNLLGNNNSSNVGNVNPSSAAAAKTSAAASSSAINRNHVTSLDWKGPSAPVLLSTCGVSACIWDLRTSLFSGTGGAGSGAGVTGARPNARFTTPEDGPYRAGGSLIHCAYARDESAHSFATLDSVGVVRIWDDRRAHRPKHSFLACAGGGVGIASIAPPETSMADAVEPRWVTWGLDDAQSYASDLVVKVWTESSSTLNKSRANTTTTSSTDVDVSDRNGDGDGETTVGATPYHVTARISMPGAAAARVHPSFPNGILLFKDNPPRRHDRGAPPPPPQQILTGPSTPMGFGVTAAGDMKEGVMDGGLGIAAESPDKMILATDLKMRLTPELAVVQTPPSPNREGNATSTPPVHEGWEAELWQIAAEDSSLPPAEAGEANTEGGTCDTLGAQKIAAFRGGGVEEDALSFAPSKDDVSDVIAVDLTLVPPIDGTVNINMQKKEELSLCVLTKTGRLTVYGVPEASGLAKEKDTENGPSNTRGRTDIIESNLTSSVSSRVYRQSSTDHQPVASSPWWDKHEEEDLFGEANATGHESPRKASMESMRSAAVDGDSKPPLNPQFDMDLSSNSAVRGVSRLPDGIAEKASAPSIIPDVDLEEGAEVDVDTSATGDVQNVPIDPAVAARAPCPPLCGAAFSGTGELVTFNNGPVKRMWSYYQSNESMSPSGPSLRFSHKSHMRNRSDVISSATSDEEDSSILPNQDLASGQTTGRNQTLPRTLADLIEMNLRSQTLQWGDKPDDDIPSDDGDGSSSSSSDGSSSYEDGELQLESDESDGISESDDSQGFFRVSSNDFPRENQDNMFDDYFSTARKSLEGTEHDDSNGAFAGLPSLSPVVAITRKYDGILLNGQTPELANFLKLGDAWWLTKDFTAPDASAWQNGEKHANGLEGLEDNSLDHLRNSSDPYLSAGGTRETFHTRSSSSSASKSSKHTSMMGNLKKMFANQLPTAMTPPDQRLFNTKSKENSAKIDRPIESSDSGSNNLDRSTKLHLGVYMLENPQTPEAASERLSITHRLCLYNAQVCVDSKQSDKADTWTLLAQTIESIFTFEMDETDGWGGVGDALTTGIVEHILRYYEVHGDFQMLSTIVCVLTFGRDRRKLSRGGGDGRYQLLPKFDDRRYDNYISRYSALLYGWGCLDVRAEVSKRFAYSTHWTGEETFKQQELNILGDRGSGTFKSILAPHSRVVPSVTFMPLCGRCMEPVTDENDICLKCKECAFQCSICDTAVRGFCTWCPLCGHGGHTDHMMQWFQHHKVCPTGCGCICMLETSPSHPQSSQ